MDTIVSGFRTCYLHILNNKVEFLRKIQELFANVTTRRILRPTNSYSTILRRSYHPDFLRDGVDRQFIISRLLIEDTDLNSPLIKLEMNQLLECNIPYFSSYTNNKGLTSYKGAAHDFFAVEPLKIILDKVNSLNLEELNQQCNLIRMALLANHNANHNKENKVEELQYFKINNPSQPLTYSFEVSERLFEKKILGDYHPTDISWISTLISGKNHVSWDVSPVSYDLYNGTSGVALFTNYFKIYTKDTDMQEKLSVMTQACVQNIINLLEKIEKGEFYQINLGAFTGISGYMYLLQHVIHVEKDYSLYHIIERLHEVLKKYQTKTKSQDVLEGHAGIVMVMVSLYEQFGNEEFLDTAEVSVNYLLKTLQMEENLVYWKDPISNNYYSGFAHGSSGISAALSKYNKYRKNLGVEKIIIKAVNFENSLFNKNINNWYSSTGKSDNISLAWCHGAPGILLSRNILLESGIDNSEIRKDVETALDTILHFGFGRNRSMCHGDMGNLSIIQPFQQLVEVKTTIKKVENFLYHYFSNHSLDKGTSRGVESIGLMIGLSGIGYGFLKLYDESIPNILALESPK